MTNLEVIQDSGAIYVVSIGRSLLRCTIKLSVTEISKLLVPEERNNEND